MARRTSLVDLGDPIGTAVRLVRLVRRDLDKLFELAERARDRRKAYRIIDEHIDGKLSYEEARKRLERLARRVERR